MELVPLDGKGRHLGVADFDPGRIGVGIEFGAYCKALPCGCRADQLDNCPVADERFTAPVLGDEREASSAP